MFLHIQKYTPEGENSPRFHLRPEDDEHVIAAAIVAREMDGAGWRTLYRDNRKHGPDMHGFNTYGAAIGAALDQLL